MQPCCSPGRSGWLWAEWWSSKSGSHGPLVVTISVYLAGRRLAGLQEPARAGHIGLLLMAVTLPTANLASGTQCSGIHSLIALCALLSLIAYLVHGPPWDRLSLLLLALPLALLGNILRVAKLMVVARNGGGDTPHRI